MNISQLLRPPKSLAPRLNIANLTPGKVYVHEHVLHTGEKGLWLYTANGFFVSPVDGSTYVPSREFVDGWILVDATLSYTLPERL